MTPVGTLEIGGQIAVTDEVIKTGDSVVATRPPMAIRHADSPPRTLREAAPARPIVAG
jgi:hypothetical protein